MRISGPLWGFVLAGAGAGTCVWMGPDLVQPAREAVREEATEAVDEAVKDEKARVDSLALILSEIASDTTPFPPLIQDAANVAHWDARLARLERLAEQSIRMHAISAERQLRTLCWTSRNQDRDCR